MLFDDGSRPAPPRYDPHSPRIDIPRRIAGHGHILFRLLVPLADPLLIYSTVTKLALHVARRYYRDLHYAWCAPTALDPLSYANPPSSDPIKLYWQFRRDLDGYDLHSAAVLQNRNGIKRGADSKMKEGVITANERHQIAVLADRARLEHFAPMLLVVPFALAGAYVRAVPIEKRANPLSEEYIVDGIPRSFFNILQIEG